MENKPILSKKNLTRVGHWFGWLLVVLGFILVIRLTSQPVVTAQQKQPDALANSNDRCVVCHRQSSPGIVEQFGHSTMAAAKVSCTDCHEVAADYPGARTA